MRGREYLGYLKFQVAFNEVQAVLLIKTLH